MTPCARGCCWTPFSCAKGRDCRCHRDEHTRKTERDALKTASRITYKDPVPREAIWNLERAR